VLEQLFQVVGHSLAAHVHPTQAVVVQQVAKHGLDGALSQVPVAEFAPALLALPVAAIGRVVNRLVSCWRLVPGTARRLEWALLAVAVSGPVFRAGFGGNVEAVKGQHPFSRMPTATLVE
jgi:hypothetical protein